MKYFYIAFIPLIVLSCKSEVSCDKYKELNYIPINLEDSFNYLNCNLSANDIKSFKEKDEREAVSEFHFSIGLFMRNNWGLWSGESELFEFFENLGVTHPDDISGIIITSYHREINGKNTQFDKIVSEVKAYWERRELEEKEELKQKFDNLSILDTIEFNYPFGFIDNAKNHNFENQACYALGLVTNKEKYKFQLKVKLIDNCNEEGIIISGNYFDLKDSITAKEIINNPEIVLKKNEEYWCNLDHWREY